MKKIDYMGTLGFVGRETRGEQMKDDKMKYDKIKTNLCFTSCGLGYVKIRVPLKIKASFFFKSC